jgi:hypothetical protein
MFFLYNETNRSPDGVGALPMKRSTPMADGNNRAFMKYPKTFVRTHSIAVAASRYTKAMNLQRGIMAIDLVSVSPQGIILEDYTQREHKFGSQPVQAWYLPSAVDDTSTLGIDSQCHYLFTDALSGCLFAAYGENGPTLTVEHVNNISRAGKSLLETRAELILGANYPYCKILSPCGDFHDPRVKTYSPGQVSNVVGVYKNGSWVFIYKTSDSTCDYL